MSGESASNQWYPGPLELVWQGAASLNDVTFNVYRYVNPSVADALTVREGFLGGSFLLGSIAFGFSLGGFNGAVEGSVEGVSSLYLARQGALVGGAIGEAIFAVIAESISPFGQLRTWRPINEMSEIAWKQTSVRLHSATPRRP